ncbi:MAG: phosphoribosylformylglycinamidine cyclo-ligase [Desulfobulbaceae bacterium]|uniref:Phosphoribosylformylglycinamidine cyclo-ligase n=1 Tax=Candidatus Desulfobia pelagia TaxID=2841692 RepID=A0A8J6NB87_9BACT|nr:phosphoribosylformylglycinamidine cyclo-ligase [Candidatus Desulfobia pelagia]
MTKSKSSRYAESGVDIDKANEFIDNIKPLVAATFQRGVLTDIGGFGGLFALGGDRYKDPVLVSSTDGVGTKLKIAALCNKHDTIGIDLVAMCVNDIIVSGAAPLFFLDYFSVGKLDIDMATDVVRGIAKGCEIAKCSLIGGETAEMPGLYQPGDYDMAGFVVGIAERDKIIDGSEIKVGDQIIGLSSSGIHSNGYSLVRKICFEELGHTVDDHIEELGCTLGEELLKPTRIYVETLLNLFKNFEIRGIVHITGGGFTDNIPRVLPKGCKALISKGSWPIQPVFDYLQEKGNVSADEMCRTFNCGIGMVLVVNSKIVDDVMQQLNALGESAHVIGEVAAREEGDESVEYSGYFPDRRKDS